MGLVLGTALNGEGNCRAEQLSGLGASRKERDSIKKMGRNAV